MGPPVLPVETLEYPCIGVRNEASGRNGFLARLKLTEPDSWQTLFEGAEDEHAVSVVKLSENARGKAGLCALETDGEFLPPVERRPPLRIEVVGDSISCGYGNESSEPGFRTEEENGERATGAGGQGSGCGLLLHSGFRLLRRRSHLASLSGGGPGHGKHLP
jgi:hypothetical protein